MANNAKARFPVLQWSPAIRRLFSTRRQLRVICFRWRIPVRLIFRWFLRYADRRLPIVGSGRTSRVRLAVAELEGRNTPSGVFGGFEATARPSDFDANPLPARDWQLVHGTTVDSPGGSASEVPISPQPVVSAPNAAHLTVRSQVVPQSLPASLSPGLDIPQQLLHSRLTGCSCGS
jgi:hypothetical protein